MFKKISLTLLFIGLAGLLIWGGINRTLVKSNEGSGRTETQGNYNWGDARSRQENHTPGLAGGNSPERQSQSASSRNSGQGGRNGYTALREGEIEALHRALDDEYHALAVYQSVIVAFGPVEPFVEITAAEQRHIEALSNQFNKHGLPIPENPWIGQIPPFESVQQACLASAQAEIDNAALYDQIFSQVADPSLIRVFTNLRNASLENHLPQFEACQ